MKKSILLLFVGTILFSSCADDKTATPAITAPTLYEKLGGTTMVSDPANTGQMIEQGRLGLRSVVDSTIFVIAGDPELQPYFQVLLAEVSAGNLSGFTSLSRNLTDFFCVATGAKNFTYNGVSSMVDAHDPAKYNRTVMKADNAAFNRFVNDVVQGAAQNGVTDPAIISELGALLETLRTSIVQR